MCGGAGLLSGREHGAVREAEAAVPTARCSTFSTGLQHSANYRVYVRHLGAFTGGRCDHGHVDNLLRIQFGLELLWSASRKGLECPSINEYFLKNSATLAWLALLLAAQRLIPSST
jgi:hypothetical protein